MAGKKVVWLLLLNFVSTCFSCSGVLDGLYYNYNIGNIKGSQASGVPSTYLFNWCQTLPSSPSPNVTCTPAGNAYQFLTFNQQTGCTTLGMNPIFSPLSNGAQGYVVSMENTVSSFCKNNITRQVSITVNCGKTSTPQPIAVNEPSSPCSYVATLTHPSGCGSTPVGTTTTISGSISSSGASSTGGGGGVNPNFNFDMPVILFPEYQFKDIVTTPMWMQVGYSDIYFSAEISAYDYPDFNPGVILSKDLTGTNYGRLEIHSDGRVAAFGFNISMNNNSGCFSPDNNGWCSSMTSPSPIPLNTTTSVSFLKEGSSYYLLINGQIVVDYTENIPYYLESNVRWGIGSLFTNPGYTNYFPGTISTAVLSPGYPYLSQQQKIY